MPFWCCRPGQQGRQNNEKIHKTICTGSPVVHFDDAAILLALLDPDSYEGIAIELACMDRIEIRSTREAWNKVLKYLKGVCSDEEGVWFSPDWLKMLRDEALCCGAGDNYPLIAPAGAREAAGLVSSAAREQGCDVLVSASPMCALHLRSSLPDAQEMELVDIARVIARSLGIGS